MKRLEKKATPVPYSGLEMPTNAAIVEKKLSCLVLSCLLTLYTAVMSFEILFPGAKQSGYWYLRHLT